MLQTVQVYINQLRCLYLHSILIWILYESPPPLFFYFIKVRVFMYYPVLFVTMQIAEP